jgi:hypothetical protein
MAGKEVEVKMADRNWWLARREMEATVIIDGQKKPYKDFIVVDAHGRQEAMLAAANVPIPPTMNVKSLMLIDSEVTVVE